MVRLASHYGYWNANYSRTGRKAFFGAATLELFRPASAAAHSAETRFFRKEK